MAEITDRTHLLRNVGLGIIVLAIYILVPLLIGFGKGAFTSDAAFKQFLFYIIAGIAGIVILIFIFTYTKLAKLTEFGDGVSFASQGEAPSLKFFKGVSNIKFFLISAILFPIAGLVNFFTSQTLFTGVPFGVVKQQYTVADNLIYTNALVPIAENLLALSVMMLIILGLKILFKKLNASKNTFTAIVWLPVSLLMGAYGVIVHQLVYAGSEANLFFVFVFWTIGALITILTGNFIPFWIMHLSNNLFISMKQFFSSEAVGLWVGAVIVLLIFITIAIFRFSPRSKK